MTSSWNFILTLLRQGKTVEELADICNTTYKNMWNRIRRHEVKDNCIYMNEKQLRPRKINKGLRGQTLAVCPVTKKARVPEDCAECFEKDCKGKIQDDPEEKKAVFSRCSGCCHNLTDNCGLCVSAYGSEKGCNLFETDDGETKEPPEFLKKKLNIPDPDGKTALHCQTAETPETINWSELEDFPDQCKYCKSYVFSVNHPGCANFETCEFRKGEPVQTVQKIVGYKVSSDQFKQELKAAAKLIDGRALAIDLPTLPTTKITVAKQVYAEIERQIDHCDEMIEMAKRTWSEMEKERRSWEAILSKIIPERSPEEKGEEPGGES